MRCVIGYHSCSDSNRVSYPPNVSRYSTSSTEPIAATCGVPAGAHCWVVGHTDIVAGLCLSGIAGGHWLTGLLVAPSQRNQGLATRLITQALAANDGPVWLFCEPKVIAFYRQLNFSEARVC